MIDNNPTDYQLLYEQNSFAELVSIAHSRNLNVQDNPFDCRFFAAALFRLGNFVEALPILEDLSSFYGDDPDHLSILAATYRRVGQLDNASSCFEKALAINPDSLAIKNNFANLLIDQQKYSEAMSLLDSLLAIDPEYNDAIANKHRLQSLIKHYENTAIPNSTYDPLSLAFAPDEVKSARSRYIKPSKSKPINSQFPEAPLSDIYADHVRLLEKSLQDCQYALSLKVCGDMLHTHGPSSYIYEKASEAYIQLEKYSEAENALLHSIALGGFSQKHFVNLVSLTSMRKDTRLAQYYLAKAAEIDPESPYIKQLRDQVASTSDSSAPTYSFA